VDGRCRVSDGLTVGGGGVLGIATDEQWAAADRLDRAAGSLSEIVARASSLPRPALPHGESAYLLEQSAESVGAGVLSLTDAEGRARATAGSLRLAAEAYGLADRAADSLLQMIGAQVAQTVGRLAPLLVFQILPIIVTGAAAAGILEAMRPGTLARAGTDAGAALTRSGLLSEPVVVELVRTTAMSLDDVGLGMLPVGLGGALGDQGLGITGTATAAGTLVAVGRALGLFRETPVRLVGAESKPLERAPQGFADRFSRIPSGERDGEAQVVVERYSAPGLPDRFEVHIGGTVTFDPVASDEPWDQTSNMVNAAGGVSGSAAAVTEALRAAGVGADDQVVVSGYSQGAGTAAAIAAAGDFDVRGVVTFAGPTGQVAIPEHIPTVIVEHTDDLVPALGGVQENAHAVVVQRRALDPGEAGTMSEPVPAHLRPAYAETAALMDDARSDRLREASAALADFTTGYAPVSTTAYHFDRGAEPGDPVSGGSASRRSVAR